MSTGSLGVGCCPPGRGGWVVVHRGVGGLLSTGSLVVGCCPPGRWGWGFVHRGVSGLLFIDVRVPLPSDCSELVGSGLQK